VAVYTLIFTTHATYTTHHALHTVHHPPQADAKHAWGVREGDTTHAEPAMSPHLTTPDRKTSRNSTHTHNTACDPPAFIVRMFETHGSRGRAVLRISSRIMTAIATCVCVNILEEQVCVCLCVAVRFVCSLVFIYILSSYSLHYTPLLH
jgi:hypothetical protein